MLQIWSIVPALLSTLGVGGLLGAYVQIRAQRRGEVERQEHALKEKRYLCILMLTLTKLNPSVGLPKLRANRPDLPTLQDVDNELVTELLNGIIFADQNVLKSLADFIQSPHQKTFVDVANAMRKDLWGHR